MTVATKMDDYLRESGAAALVLREHLSPVEGTDAVFFPPTFAKGDNFAGGYNIDGDPSGENVCLVDTVGSQANRLEPLFARDPYKALVPQLVVRAGDREVSIFEAGHRAGDALLRATAVHGELQQAFRAQLRGDASKLAAIAPTSLVFGVWDSRDTQAKAPRIVASTVRAFNVRKLTRSAQYAPPLDYVKLDLLPEPTDKATKDTYSEKGFIHVPASATHGGVIAKGGVRRDATLSLAALRLLTAGTDAERTKALQRYILGLSLVALTAPLPSYLRQGCNLVLDASHPEPRRFEEVYPSGERRALSISHPEAIDYAKAAAEKFGVGASRVVDFERERALADKNGGEKPAKASRRSKA